MAAERRKKGTHGGSRPGAGPKRKLEDAVLLNVRMARADVGRLRSVARQKGLTLSKYVRGVLLRSLAAQARRE